VERKKPGGVLDGINRMSRMRGRVFLESEFEAMGGIWANKKPAPVARRPALILAGLAQGTLPLAAWLLCYATIAVFHTSGFKP